MLSWISLRHLFYPPHRSGCELSERKEGRVRERLTDSFRRERRDKKLSITLNLRDLIGVDRATRVGLWWRGRRGGGGKDESLSSHIASYLFAALTRRSEGLNCFGWSSGYQHPSSSCWRRNFASKYSHISRNDK